ncbi:MAG: cardiolipin synthase [Thermoguttaceae bacterium]|jgi:cardiolipin synthase
MPFQLSTLLAIAHAAIVILISVRVIMRRPANGVALAWLFLVAVLPLAGAVVYLLVGERRVGLRRARRIAALRSDYAMLAQVMIGKGLTNVDWARHRPEAQGMDRLGTTMVGVPTVAGSEGHLFSASDRILAAIAADVDRARTSVLMEFYIWNEGGAADEVLEALIRAAGRGVSCRVLVDALGARPWWRGPQPERLRAAGVHLQPALPAGLFQMLVGRNDLRLHRKIVVVDGELAWTGSMNLVDPRFFKQDANVGQWVDAMVRLEGTAVIPLAMTMIGDWMLETAESIETIVESAGLGLVRPRGTTDVQVIPSGPGETDDGLLQMLIAVINSAREELVLTTPYFVPDESLLRALRAAAGRGVRVDMILPEKVDSVLTRYASRSYYDELLDMGVRIHLYGKGLLHTKSMTADRRISMFGTVNLDMRSLWLNYEVALFVYGTEFAEELHALQQSYMDDCEGLLPAEWAKRPRRQRFLENVLRLMSPVL